MKSKDSLRLESLRAIKSAIIILETKSGAKSNLTQEDEIALLQKLVKQRKESATIFTSQGRVDLAEKEIAQERIISEFQEIAQGKVPKERIFSCLLYTSPSPRDKRLSRMPSSA